MRTIRIYRNARTSDRGWFFTGTLPRRQRLIFLGGWLIILRPKG